MQNTLQVTSALRPGLIWNCVAACKERRTYIEYATRLVVVMELVQIVLCIVIVTTLAQNDSIEFADDLIRREFFVNQGDESVISAHLGENCSLFKSCHWSPSGNCAFETNRMEHAQYLRSKKQDREREMFVHSRPSLAPQFTAPSAEALMPLPFLADSDCEYRVGRVNRAQGKSAQF